MSQPPQKPGPSDVQDLRARLGLKPTRSETSPSPPQPASTTSRLAQQVPSSTGEAVADTPGMAGDDLFARVMSPPAGGPVPAGVQPHASPAPSSLLTFPAPGGPLKPLPPELADALEDEATRPQLSPGIAGLPPQDMDPRAFLQQAPAVRRPSGVPASAVPVAPPEEPAPRAPASRPDPFASPLTAGPLPGQAYAPPGPLVVPPMVLPEPRSITSELPPMSPQTKRSWIRIIGIAVAVGVVGTGLGYTFGQIGKDRQILNRRIDDAQAVLGAVEAKFAVIKEIAPQINKMNPEQPDYELANKLKVLTCELPLDQIIGDNLLLGRLITPDLVRFAGMAADLQAKARRHGYLTTVKHRSFLEKITQASVAVQGGTQDLFVHFRPNARPGGPPPQGHLVNVVGQPTVEGKTVMVPVRALTGPDVRPVDIDMLVGLDRHEMLQSSGPNVLAIHADRVQELKGLVSELDKLGTALIANLRREAGKSKVTTF